MVVDKGNPVDEARQKERLKTNDNYSLLQEKKKTRARYKKYNKERRSRLLTQQRYGKGGRFDRLADSLGEIPILGDTALAPMRGFLKGTTKLYEATHDKEGHSDINNLDDIKEVAGDVFKAVKDMKK